MDAQDLLTPTVIVPVAIVLVLLLGGGIAVFKIMAGKGRSAALQRWCRGAYGLWTGGEDCGLWEAGRAQAALRDWYGANHVGAFWDVVGGLRSGTTGNPAWDRVRALDLLRIATAATYIDADQCWTESAKIAAELQSRFRSWDELAQAFEAGMQAWQRGRGVTSPQELGRVQRNLPVFRQQIWPAIAFHAKVVADD